MNIRSWLRRVPQPTQLRCDGKRTIMLGQGKSKWKEAMTTLESIQPELLECLDKDGNVLRATQLQGDETETDDEHDKRKAKSELAELARVIVDATDKGAQRHEQAYSKAFDKLVELANAVMARNSKLEAVIERLWDEREEAIALAEHELAEKGDGSDDNPLAPMLGALVPRLLEKNAEKKPNGKAVRK